MSQQPRLVAIALGWSGDVHAAREAAQETLSRAEVADILEIAQGTVKATLSHARDRLRQLLVQEDTR